MENNSHFDAALREDVAVIYKHSTRCNLSHDAYRQVREFVAAHADTPVFIVDVLQHRAVSNHVAEQLSIRHQSPQVIVLRRGKPSWDGSHFDVTAEAIAAHLDN